MRAWDSRTLRGRLMRLPLRCIPEKSVVPVLSGVNRGLRWTVGSAPHGAWLGTLERDKLAHFAARIRPGMTVWDIGANVGLYTLPAAQAAKEIAQEHMTSYEPAPRHWYDTETPKDRRFRVVAVGSLRKFFGYPIFAPGASSTREQAANASASAIGPWCDMTFVSPGKQ